MTLAGTFQTLRVQPIADAGVVKNRGNIWIWYTDDDRRMPVQMRARLLLGNHHHPPGQHGGEVDFIGFDSARASSRCSRGL